MWFFFFNCGISKITTFGVNIGVEICLTFLLSSDTEDRFDVVFFNCGISKIARLELILGLKFA